MEQSNETSTPGTALVLVAASATPPSVPALAGSDFDLSDKDRAFEQVRAANKAALLQALSSIGATSATVTYSGSGDSGQVDEIWISPDSALYAAKGVKVVYLTVQYTYDREGETFNFTRRILGIDRKELSLRQALEDFAWDYIGLYHAGWENNDGGDGEMTIDVTTQVATLGHNDYYTESNHSSHEC